MGKEEMKPEVNKPGEGKPAGEAEQPQEAAKKNTGEEDKPQKPTGDESKESKDAPPPPPPPPPLILLKVNMHCEGCARKVRRCLRHLEGVEDVQTDCKAQKVVVKGERADPLRVLERLQRKSHLQVDLLSPIPKPPSKDPEKEDEKQKPKPMEEKKEEPPPPPITVVLRVHMHCEACAHEIQKRIKKMKGVSSAEPDLKSSRVAVKGIFDPAKLVEFVYKRTGKHAIIVEKDASEKKEGGDGKGKDEAAEGGGSAGDAAEKKGAEPADGQGTKEGDGSSPAADDNEDAPLLNAMRSEYSSDPLPPHFYFREPLYYSPLETYPPPAYMAPPPLIPVPPVDTYHLLPYAAQPPPPSQMFSDENPNACYVM